MADDNYDPLDLIKDMCPKCGNEKRVWRNSCGEMQCDNCGYSEDED